MAEVTVVDYLPSAELDVQLAAVVREAVRGWPDHGPVSGEIVRSALRPTATSATSLVLHRDGDDHLDAFAAIQWPATLESEGRVWGPMVCATARGVGLARTMLETVTRVVSARPGVRVRSAPIPESRTMGWALYESAGWLDSGTSSLLRRALPAPMDGPLEVTVRCARQGEYLDQALATLVAKARPDTGYATARDTYQRWAADARYVPEGLLLTEGEQGLTGAALVYPPTPRSRWDPTGRGSFSRPADEVVARAEESPNEAVLADLVTAPELAPAAAEAVRMSLVRAALAAGANAGAQVARAESQWPPLTATLTAAGFELADRFRYYTPPSESAGPPAVAARG